MNKLDQYLHNEAQSQFSDEKRQEIEETKVGHSHLSENLQYEFEKAKEYAKTRGISVKVCLWCGGPAFIKDTRSKSVPLCDKCEKARPDVERRLGMTKSTKILPGDAVKIANSRTTRTRPFWSPNNPNNKPGGRPPRPTEIF